MKRIIVTIVFSALCTLLAAQNDSTFFGLRLGQIYSEQEIVDAVSPYGKYVRRGECTDGLTVPYFFENVVWNKMSYPLFSVSCAEHEGTMISVTFGVRSMDVGSSDALEQTASALCDSLSVFDSSPRVEYSADSTFVRSSYVSKENKDITIGVDRAYENGSISAFYINYTNRKAEIHLLVASLFPPRPKIQDTFFGLKLGEHYGVNDIRKAFYHNGEYLDCSNEGNTVSYTYTDVYFAGHRWNYCVVDITDDGRFYSIRAYDSLSDNSYNYDERNEAKQTYDSFKSRLDEKYGNAVDTDEDGNAVPSIGERMMWR